MKVALVHDFLREYGGAERVLEVLHEMYPRAPIYTAFVDYDSLGPHQERIKKWPIKTTWAQYIPFITRLYSPLRFLAPFFFRSLDLGEYDVIISSTNAYYAKGVIKRPLRGSPSATHRGARMPIHICYCHTPPRSLYGYPTAMDWRKNPIIRLYGTIVNHSLRIYDFKTAQAVDYFIANSQEVQRRIKKFYRRESVVIYPPVEVSKASQVSKGDYYLYVGKLAYAKHVDIAIGAANKLKVTLKIVGKGGEEQNLKRIAGSTVEFLGEVSDEELADVYQNCQALIFPAEEEDFGMVPVEAASFGKPVIAFRSGGVVESVVEGKTGLFFGEATVESLVSVLKQFDRVKFDNSAIKKHAEKFSKERFKHAITEFTEKSTEAQKKHAITEFTEKSTEALKKWNIYIAI